MTADHTYLQRMEVPDITADSFQGRLYAGVRDLTPTMSDTGLRKRLGANLFEVQPLPMVDLLKLSARAGLEDLHVVPDVAHTEVDLEP